MATTVKQATDSVWKRHIHEPFIRAALLIALTTGFGYGATMVALLALGIRPGAWYPPLLQSHGHAQLLGWLGCFIMGMGLFFLPRLRGAKLQNQERLLYVLLLIVTGIALRTVAQPLAGWFAAESWAQWLRAAILGASILELAGMALLITLLAATVRAQKPLALDAPAYPVMPFIQIGLICFALAYVVNLPGAWNAFTHAQAVIPARYDQTFILLMLYGVAIPMVVVFALRNLPLFLRLTMSARYRWRPLAWIYAVGLALRLLPQLVAIANDALTAAGVALPIDEWNMRILDPLAIVGTLIINGCILFFVWRLDLQRFKPPWIVYRAPNTRPDLDYLRKPTRPNYPDNGEYGRFELLIYSAFIWLVVACLLDVLRALPFVANNFTIPQDAARHALFVGFITLLIFGMAVRMGPGFSGKRGAAHPELVVWLFVLGNLAALLRVVPTLFPESSFALMLWGLSGFVGWLGVLVLTIIMWGTFHREPKLIKPQ